MEQFVIISLAMLSSALAFKLMNIPNTIFLKLWISFLGFLSAFRSYNIGNDTKSYCDLFYAITTVEWADLLTFTRFEAGYLYFCKFTSLISENHQILLIISSIIIFYLYYFVIKRESYYYWVSIVFLFTSGIFRFSVSAIRQCLAISIILFSIDWLQKKQYFKFIIATMISVLFHKSMILFSILLIVCNFKWTKRQYVYSFAICGLLSLLLKQVLQYIGSYFNYDRYIGSIYDTGITTASIFLCLITMVVCILAIIAKKEYLDDFIFKCTFTKMCILLISINLNAIDRIADCFTIFEILLATNLLKYYKGNSKIIVFSILFVIYFGYSLIWGIFRPATQTVWPYSLL